MNRLPVLLAILMLLFAAVAARTASAQSEALHIAPGQPAAQNRSRYKTPKKSRFKIILEYKPPAISLRLRKRALEKRSPLITRWSSEA
jgi:hypothetical protein